MNGGHGIGVRIQAMGNIIETTALFPMDRIYVPDFRFSALPIFGRLGGELGA